LLGKLTPKTEFRLIRELFVCLEMSQIDE